MIDAGPSAVYVTPDAAPPRTLGARCGTCGTGEHCLPFPGGSCAAACGNCSGTCVELTRHGEQCLASCRADSECRVDEGYLCDRAWQACMPANAAAIVARDCGSPTGIARDPSFVPPVELGEGSAPSAILGADGSLIAMYGIAGGLEVARIDGANRIARSPVSSPGAHPTLARSGTKLLAAWSAERAVLLATSADEGKTWSQPINVAEPGEDATRPSVVAGRGVVYVAYASQGLRGRASRDGGATFEAPVTALFGAHGELAVAADGTLHAIAIDGSPLGAFGSGNQRVDYAWSRDGRTFVRKRLSIAGEALPFYFANPQVALDDRRKWTYVAYTRGHREGRWDIALAATRDLGKTWVRARIGDDPACAIHAVPNLAVDPVTGALHVTWYDSRGMRYAHASCGAGLAGCRQHGRINDKPLATFSLLPGKSIAEHDALVVDGARRTLHAVWMQPTAAGIRVFHARAKLPLR